MSSTALASSTPLAQSSTVVPNTNAPTNESEDSEFAVTTLVIIVTVAAGIITIIAGLIVIIGCISRWRRRIAEAKVAAIRLDSDIANFKSKMSTFTPFFTENASANGLVANISYAMLPGPPAAWKQFGMNMVRAGDLIICAVYRDLKLNRLLDSDDNSKVQFDSMERGYISMASLVPVAIQPNKQCATRIQRGADRLMAVLREATHVEEWASYITGSMSHKWTSTIQKLRGSAVQAKDEMVNGLSLDIVAGILAMINDVAASIEPGSAILDGAFIPDMTDVAKPKVQELAFGNPTLIGLVIIRGKVLTELVPSPEYARVKPRTCCSTIELLMRKTFQGHPSACDCAVCKLAVNAMEAIATLDLAERYKPSTVVLQSYITNTVRVIARDTGGSESTIARLNNAMAKHDISMTAMIEDQEVSQWKHEQSLQVNYLVEQGEYMEYPNNIITYGYVGPEITKMIQQLFVTGYPALVADLPASHRIALLTTVLSTGHVPTQKDVQKLINASATRAQSETGRVMSRISSELQTGLKTLAAAAES